MQDRLLVDARWDGNFGIGRFGREVRRRLGSSLHDFYKAEASALSPKGIIGLRTTLAREKRKVFYSPAFTGTVPTKGTVQLLTVFDLIHLDEPAESSSMKRAYYKFVVSPAIKKAGWVATSSNYSRDRLASWLGPGSSEIQIDNVGCGVSADFSPSDAAFDEKHFVVVSNPGSHKNVETVLGAVAGLRDSRLTWVVGDTGRAADLVREFGVGDRVVLRSNLSDMELRDLYCSATALLFPSKIEGFGLPPVEAMACDVPVIFSPRCEAVEETSGSVSGNIAVDGLTSVPEWQAAMKEVSANPRRLTVSQTIRDRYSWETVSGSVLRTLTEAINRLS